MKAARRRAVLAAALVATALSPDAVRAQGLPAPRVMLLRPPAAPGAVSEALVRLQAELKVEGFDAQVTDVDLGPDVRASLEKVAPTMAATAVVAVVSASDPASAELWVVDRMTGKTVVRRVHADPKEAARIAEVLSVRAVELLRASFLELAITSRPSPDVVDVPLPSAPVVTRFATEALEEPDWRWAVEAGGGGVGAIQSVSGGTTLLGEFLPVARVQRALSARFCVRVTIAGLGTQARVDIPGGYANVGQTIALVEGLIRFRRGHRVEPVVSLGAGVLYLTAEGHETSPYLGDNSWHVSAAADAGVGLRFPIRPRRVELGVEFHALLAEPYPIVRFFDTEVARAGRPSLLASVTLLGGI
ncbi:MAG TPA: hypothetical protein VKQ32_24785 [Polyangia bacterium]|nr:hypothetical protein [Polyangia bacterium]